MRSRLHPALVVTLVLVICAGLLGGLAYYRERRTATASGLAAFLPREEGLVFGVDLAQLRESGVLDALSGSKVVQEPDYVSFVQDTGFNYEQDLDYALVWVRQGTVCALLRGRFDWSKLKTYAASHLGTCRSSFCRMEGSTPERKISFFPLSRSVLALAVSQDDWAASQLSGQKPSRVGMIIPDRPLWLLAPASSLKDPTSLPAGTRLLAKAVEGAEKVTLSLATTGSGAAIELDVTCRSSQEASTLAFQLDGITRLLKEMIAREKQSPNPRDLSGVLAAGVFNHVDRRVLGRWPVERQFLESILRDSQ